LLQRGQPAVEVVQPVVEVGQLALERGGDLRLNAPNLLFEARHRPPELGGGLAERAESPLNLRAQLPPLHLREARSHGLDLGLSRGQPLLQVGCVLLDEALDLGDRRWVHPDAGGEVGDDAPVLERDLPVRGRDVRALVPDQADELGMRPSDGGSDEILDLRRGKRILSHVRSGLPGQGRDGSG
jgi:hypothetical protein